MTGFFKILRNVKDISFNRKIKITFALNSS